MSDINDETEVSVDDYVVSHICNVLMSEDMTSVRDFIRSRIDDEFDFGLGSIDDQSEEDQMRYYDRVTQEYRRLVLRALVAIGPNDGIIEQVNIPKYSLYRNAFDLD